MKHSVYQLANGRWIPAHYDARTQQWKTEVCLPGFLYAFARNIESLARTTGRTYSSRNGAHAAISRL